MYFVIRGTIKSLEKDSLISIEYFLNDDICELSKGQNVSSLSEFSFTTTLQVIPIDMDGLHLIPSDKWIPWSPSDNISALPDIYLISGLKY